MALRTVTFGFQNSKKNSFRGNYMRKYGIYKMEGIITYATSGKYLAPLWTGLLADGAMYVVGLLFSWRQRCHYRQLSDDMNNII